LWFGHGVLGIGVGYDDIEEDDDEDAGAEG
jgi:hypothetical protein